MFTGIVEAVGRIKHLSPLEAGLRLSIAPGDLDLADMKTGDSVAVNGVCLTVVALAPGTLTVDVSRETLSCTCGLDAPGEVNLEKALRLDDRLGGHLVTGHVDGVGTVTRFERVGECHTLSVRAPTGLGRYIARKGSIAVHGVSLTVNEVAGDEFTVNLIPFTLEATTLKDLAPGARVNLEVDLIARYVERLHSYQP
ncbi:riboflavin synthase [Pelomicrobium sp. G1]|jgi:riboflavin synthase|uniref:riboflavin synthase n=1 Tax=unclassified Pelomicrobium TaxID=2815318 RepID=UPI003F76AC6C